jgi:hypothetical protein
MGHSDISDTVDNTDAFRNGGVANPDSPSCSALLIWYVKRPLKKFDKKIFDLSLLILGVFMVYLSSQKVTTVFFCI